MKGVMKLSRDPLLRRSVCAAGQPAYSLVRRRIGLSASDRKFPPLTGRSGTQRARRLPLAVGRCCQPGAVYAAAATAGAWRCARQLRSSASSMALRSYWLRPRESSQPTRSPVMPFGACTACHVHPRADSPSRSITVTQGHHPEDTHEERQGRSGRHRGRDARLPGPCLGCGAQEADRAHGRGP